MKLALGTAQFGLDYGISNTKGKVTIEEAKNILSLAQQGGINTIDTAWAYGDAESVLGNLNILKQFNIISKISRGTPTNKIKDKLLECLRRLNVKKLAGLLLHDIADLNNETFKVLKNCKDEQYIDKVGVSVYTQDDVEKLLDSDLVDIVQLPIHLFDQTFFKNGVLDKLKQKEIEIHARSIFCQGLYFLNEEKLPSYFLPIKESLKALKSEVESLNYNLPEVLLGFVNGLPQIDKIIIGVTTQEELREIISSCHKNIPFDYSKYDQSLSNLLSPKNWPSLP